jgi:hypothetical protein
LNPEKLYHPDKTKGHFFPVTFFRVKGSQSHLYPVTARLAQRPRYRRRRQRLSVSNDNAQVSGILTEKPLHQQDAYRIIQKREGS